MQRPRVLAIAEAANPEWVSVPLVGWSHARALAAVADVHLVTHVRNAPALRRAGLDPERDFTALDTEAVSRPLWRLGQWLRGGSGRGWTAVSAVNALAYYWFEHSLWRRFGERIRAGEFDVVHRLTPLSPTVPSRIAKRCRRAGVPFVLGPLNGGTPWPRQFDRARRAEAEWLSYLRGLHRLLPAHRATRRWASAILVGSRAVWDQMAPAVHDRCIYVPENGIDVQRLPAARRPSPQHPLRVAFLGRLVPYKGPDMLLEASVPLLREGRLELVFLGDGPLRGSLERSAAEAGVAERVRFAGWLEHPRALAALAEAQVLGLPSIREFGGGVVLEAMALGVVPLVVDYGGPAELVTPRTGLAVPLGSRSDVVAGLRRELARAAAEPARLAPLAEAGRRRVSTWFTWDVKARQVLEVYRWVLGQSPDRPWFGMPFPDATGEASAGGSRPAHAASPSRS